VRKGFLEDLTHRAISQLASDARFDPTKRAPVNRWMNYTNSKGCGATPEASEVLCYLGDWSEPDSHPFVFALSQGSKEGPERLPLICSAERVARALIYEVFEWR
jgi:hypothetical protein